MCWSISVLSRPTFPGSFGVVVPRLLANATVDGSEPTDPPTFCFLQRTHRHFVSTNVRTHRHFVSTMYEPTDILLTQCMYASLFTTDPVLAFASHCSMSSILVFTFDVAPLLSKTPQLLSLIPYNPASKVTLVRLPPQSAHRQRFVCLRLRLSRHRSPINALSRTSRLILRLITTDASA